MATNNTTNYHLSQWVGTDYFRRDDFNSDNTKIDAALHAHDLVLNSLPGELVASSVLTQTARDMTLDLSDVDLSDYLTLTLIIDAKFGTVDNTNHYLRLNNVSAQTYHRNGSSTGIGYIMKVPSSETHQRSRIVNFFPYESGAPVACSYASDAGDDVGHNVVVASDVLWSELASINYASGSVASSMISGTGLYLYGVRKP